MINPQGILDWIRDLPDNSLSTPVEESTPSSQSQGRKRRRVQEPSPPATVADMDDPETPNSKRQRLTLAEDTELTPRTLYEPFSDPAKAPSL